jgi:hypothetical protein
MGSGAAKGHAARCVTPFRLSGNVPFRGARADIGLMVLNGGQERTEKEYRELLDKTGFRLTRVVPTDTAVSIIEAFPV